MEACCGSLESWEPSQHLGNHLSNNNDDDNNNNNNNNSNNIPMNLY